ncbi:MAG: 2-oxo acid dehydrogenase subunit E2 [Gloeomargaritaceae cyanobacterium C42_A2020_066]|nr:2-oxo acid dehydrogenase subunit E2 [Gloeomargaritaceae cyanobacterium C42_A2020_066]
MIHEVFMPALSSTMTEGKIVSWTKSPGDWVNKGDTVLVVESDKADMDVESFYEGYLAVILVDAGGVAPVGSALGLIAETEAEVADAKQRGGRPAPAAAPAPAQPELAPVAATASARENGRIVASPRAKKLARELSVDLKSLTGSGPHGRIVAEDVLQAAGRPVPVPVTPAPAPTPLSAATVAAPVVTTVPTTAPPVTLAGDRIEPFNTLQQAVVRNMVAAMTAPVFRVGYTITTDALDALYRQLKPKGVTMTALLAKAVALTLKKHPIVNASYSDQGVVYHGAINVAGAVAMEDGGLITPVLAQADQMDIYSLSRTWQDLVKRARAKQLQPAEYTTGTFTLSNLGMFGVDRFDAILPPGQGAILAVGAARPQVVVTPEGFFGMRHQMQVNLTADHRIIYGTHAAAFLQDLAKLIETDPQSLTL